MADAGDPPHGPGTDDALSGRGAPLVAIAAAAFLTVLKGAAALSTGSLALGAAALDSLIDVFISTANFFVMRRAARPPDEDHAYGHGRFENLAALGQGLFLAVAAGGLVAASVRRLASGAAPEKLGVGSLVLIVSLFVSVGVAVWLRRAAHRTGSPALAADSLHYATDFWTNGSALVALGIVAATGYAQADSLVALGVAALVFRTAAKLALEAMSDLSDRGLPETDLAKVREIVASFRPDVLGMHDLKTRRSGGLRFIDLHLEIPRQASFEEAHDRTVRVLRAIERELAPAKVFVHSDPV